jgi:tRNA threonylcarbamoyladenosine biosynthesis protein TsaB
VTVIALDCASRERAWALLSEVDGTVIRQTSVPGGALDTGLPAAIATLLAGDVEAVVVLTGPGSYTGVRAGMAAALGLATSRGVPLHGLGNLHAIAIAAGLPDAAELVAVADAGRGGVYLARFVREHGGARHVSPVQRVAVAALDTAGPLFATSDIAGLTHRLDPAAVLAAAVPHALRLPALPALGLTATHAEPPAEGP